MFVFFSPGLCGRKQKEISKAIKKAHSLGEFIFLCSLINVFPERNVTETINFLSKKIPLHHNNSVKLKDQFIVLSCEKS